MDKLQHLIKKIIKWGQNNESAQKWLSNLKTSRFTTELYSFAEKFIKKQKLYQKILIQRINYKLRSLGFHDKGYNDLKDIVEKGGNRYGKGEAAWALALWHANKQTTADYEKCLDYLKISNNTNPGRRRAKQTLVLQAEALSALNKKNEAKQLIKRELNKSKRDINLHLALANLEDNLNAKVEIINKCLAIQKLTPIQIAEENNNIKITSELSNKVKVKKYDSKTPLVSIIIPTYNSENTIENAITSLLAQTWQNIEIIVVDDCSTDNTPHIVDKFAKKDCRVKLIKSSLNQGAYVSRNIGLQSANGEFVTCHDADDWSHPQKIEIQARQLTKNPKQIGNTSQLARITRSLNFFRRGNPGYYVQENYSSLMLRTKQFKTKFGCWDAVRFGADSELIERIKFSLGYNSIVSLKTGPLYFAFHNNASLTGNPIFGFHGFPIGARLEYQDAFNSHFKTGGNLFYHFPLTKRIFKVPAPMLPSKNGQVNKLRHLNVIVLSDFRMSTDNAIFHEIKAQKHFNIKTGLAQINRYDISREEKNLKIRELINTSEVEIIVYGEEVKCDLLIIRHPPVLQYWQKYIPKIEAKNIVVIANQAPFIDYNIEGERLYNVKDCAKNLYEYFGQNATWYPIDPLVREKLLLEKEFQDSTVKISNFDWVELINSKEWLRELKDRQSRPFTIGRHGRDQYTKWPDNITTLKKVYPTKGDIYVKILGGADTPLKMIGKKPKNWKIYPFGSISVADFLSQIDVFVYFHHPGWTESFGRTIIEAMAAGVPVILQKHFKPLFKEAAIYATEDEVMEYVKKLRDNKEYYNERRDIGLNFVEQNFGYNAHYNRIKPYVEALQ